MADSPQLPNEPTPIKTIRIRLDGIWGPASIDINPEETLRNLKVRFMGELGIVGMPSDWLGFYYGGEELSDLERSVGDHATHSDELTIFYVIISKRSAAHSFLPSNEQGQARHYDQLQGISNGKKKPKKAQSGKSGKAGKSSARLRKESAQNGLESDKSDERGRTASSPNRAVTPTSNPLVRIATVATSTSPTKIVTISTATSATKATKSTEEAPNAQRLATSTLKRSLEETPESNSEQTADKRLPLTSYKLRVGIKVPDTKGGYIFYGALSKDVMMGRILDQYVRGLNEGSIARSDEFSPGKVIFRLERNRKIILNKNLSIYDNHVQNGDKIDVGVKRKSKFEKYLDPSPETAEKFSVYTSGDV